MNTVIVILVVIAALFVIVSGVWVAAALVAVTLAGRPGVHKKRAISEP
jgi:uncharacterized protein YneF (UPF0154 family)